MKLAPIVIAVAGSAAAQDSIFTVQETTEADRYVIFAEFQGTLPSGATRLDVAWSDIGLEISDDVPVTFDAWIPG